MGRTPRTVTKHFKSQYDEDLTVEVELFTWEKLDYVEAVRKAFDI
jgi:S-adenosylmethionine synthetase